MKPVFSFFVLLLLITACQSSVENGQMPELLEEKQAMLRKKQAAFKNLADEISILKSAIAEQSPITENSGELVTVTRVGRSDFSRYVVLQGSVAADNLYDASAEISGRILSLTVKEGDPVKKGQLIALIDVESIQKQRAELETSLSLAQIIFERQNRLWKQNIGSEMQFLQAENNKERLEKSLASLDVQLAKNKVFAPSSGIVERLVRQAGELASPGIPIVQILNTAQLKIVADVPENYIKAIKRGDRVDIEVLALDMKKTLPVSLIGKTVNPANRTFKVEVKLPSDPFLKPNLLAEMKIKDYESEDVVIIDLDRIQQEVGGKRFVFIADDTDKGLVARKVYIKTGNSHDGKVIIAQGLEGGESLIVEGAGNLSDGQAIEITKDKAADNG